MKVRWAPLAERRAAEAFAQIATDQPAGALRWLERLLRNVGQLQDFPDRGRMVPEIARPEIREVIVAPYRVVYRRDPARVLVLTVRHSRRAFDPREIVAEV